MSDLAMSIIILLSALSGAMVGIIVYLFLEERSYADSDSIYSKSLRGSDNGHTGSGESGIQIFCGGESRPFLQDETAWKRMGSDRYTRAD